MTTIVESVEISWTPADVFAYVTDPSHLPEWQASVVNVEHDDAPVQVGKRVVFDPESRPPRNAIDGGGCCARPTSHVGDPRRRRAGSWEFEQGVITVRQQLTCGTKERPARLVELKTRGARRDVVLLPELAGLLREHRRVAFQRGLAREQDYVFTTREGTALHYRNLAQRGLTKAANRAGLNGDGQPTLTLHDLRHTFGSHLVRQGADVVTVSRQMGHARPSITLDVYSHEFAAVQHQASVAAKLTDAFGGILSAAEE